MKRLVAIGLLWAAAAMAARAAEEGFSKAVRAEDFSAAGLTKLSPAELARLDALVRDYQSGALLAARRDAEAAAQARAAAEATAAKAVAEAQAAKTEQNKNTEGFLARAKKVIVPSGTKVEVAALETEIDGEFDGWENTTTWRMADGTIWRVANNPGSYAAKRVKNPKVRIYPAAISGYWLEFVDLDLKLRVRQLK